MSRPGRFVTFEGGEGTGKTTLIKGLERHLRSLGLSIVTTREPGGSPRAEKLRALLLSSDDLSEPMCAITEALIISAARSDHVENLIRPELENGNWVLCDRFTESTVAYQGRSAGLSELSALQEISTHGIIPDLTILLDADPKDLKDRRLFRGQTNDRFERQGISFHTSVRTAFLRIAEQSPERVKTIDALQEIDPVLMQAISIMRNRFPELESLSHSDSEGD
jgi:dTMP kinase